MLVKMVVLRGLRCLALVNIVVIVVTVVITIILCCLQSSALKRPPSKISPSTLKKRYCIQCHLQTQAKGKKSGRLWSLTESQLQVTDKNTSEKQSITWSREKTNSRWSRESIRPGVRSSGSH
jgi:hypothetical protein